MKKAFLRDLTTMPESSDGPPRDGAQSGSESALSRWYALMAECHREDDCLQALLNSLRKQATVVEELLARREARTDAIARGILAALQDAIVEPVQATRAANEPSQEPDP